MLLQRKNGRDDSTKPRRFGLWIVAIAGAAVAALVVAINLRPVEDQIEDYYQSALAYIAEGDDERAIIELGNVFQLDGYHRGARLAHADILIKNGNTPKAYGEYLRAVEKHPNDIDIRHKLAMIALKSDFLTQGDLWSEVKRHGEAAIDIDPDHPLSRGFALSLAYREAALTRAETTKKKLFEDAQALVAEFPEDTLGRRIMIDTFMNDENYERALIEIDALLALDNDAIKAHFERLAALERLGLMEELGVHLRKMYADDPENLGTRDALLRFYVSQGELDQAEAFLRELAGTDPANTPGYLSVLNFIRQVHGVDAALVEADRLIAETANNPEAQKENAIYRSMRASANFDLGKTDLAFDEIKSIIAANAESTEGYMLDIRTGYARMLEQLNDIPASQEQAYFVLERDGSHVGALNLRAGWKLDADLPSEAVIDLRRALNQSPEDIPTLILLAQAHQREGASDLARQRLSLAYDISRGDPDVAQIYAKYLLGEGDPNAAKTVVLNALERRPNNFQLALLLMQTLIQQQDWAAVDKLVEGIGTQFETVSEEDGQMLLGAMLLARGDTDEGVTLLSAVMEAQDKRAQEGGPPADHASVIYMITGAYVREDRLDEARAFLDSQSAKISENQALRLLTLVLDTQIDGESAASEQRLRDFVRENPADETSAKALYVYLEQAGRHEESMQVLDGALERMPDVGLFKWIKAGRLEQVGDIDGAIAVYTKMYEANIANDLVANNLASLITTYKKDAENLNFAFKIGRRLRSSREPAFQDTYGWIEYRRGNFEDAISYLEYAAAKMPDSVVVQYHLGLGLAALGQVAKAKQQMEMVLALASNKALFPEVDVARKVLAKLGRVEEGTPIVPDGFSVSKRVANQNEN